MSTFQPPSTSWSSTSSTPVFSGAFGGLGAGGGSAGLVSAGLVSAGLVSAGLVSPPFAVSVPLATGSAVAALPPAPGSPSFFLSQAAVRARTAAKAGTKRMDPSGRMVARNRRMWGGSS
ncbi:MAG: hypothetical protein JNL83_22790 [Myxococcales bacterium]|nr:hypothetical protein [Myxococcales bacterium]